MLMLSGTFFFALLPIKESGTSEPIYTLIKDYFAKNDINYKNNMIGFGSDGANSMMGKIILWQHY